MKIAHVANFYGPRSGGLRTAMHALGRGYLEAGHDVVLIVPGEHDAVEDTPFGRRVSVAAPEIPGWADTASSPTPAGSCTRSSRRRRTGSRSPTG